MRAIVAGCALVVLFGPSTVVADDFFCLITRIETKDGKTTISGNKGKKDEFTLDVSNEVKVARGKFNKETKMLEVAESVEDGLKSDAFKEVSAEKPLFAQLTTNKDVVTQIIIGPKKKGKDK